MVWLLLDLNINPISILSAHLLLCGDARQLVEQYVVFCCDCSQSGGGGQVEEIH